MLSCLIFQGFIGFYVTGFWHSFYIAYSDIKLVIKYLFIKYLFIIHIYNVCYACMCIYIYRCIK